MFTKSARTTLVILALASTALAHDVSPPAGDIDVRLVCEDGCDEVRHRGQRYVVGEYGARYGIALTNRSDRWIEAVVSVDGRDVVDGRRVSPRSRGYLLAPWQSFTIEGWRTSAAEVAAFRFTSVGDSYVGRIGEGQNAGQVRVDVYPERRAPVPRPRPVMPEPWNDDADKAPRSETTDAGKPRDTLGPDEPRREDGRNLGTSYGETRWQPVEEVDFERADPNRPSRTVTIWYDDYRGLVARGVLPRRSPWPDAAQTPRWVPPPPPRDW